jgi:hypothetical protein
MSQVVDLGKVMDGARLAGSLPYLTDEIDKMEDALISRVLSTINDHTLTPDAAYAAWLELASYRSLLKRFRTRIAVGVSAGERSQDALNQLRSDYK